MAVSNHYELISLGPEATGWRAVMQGGGDSAVIPLAGWGVFQWTQRKPDGSVVKDLGRIMAGLIGDQSPHGPIGGFLCAEGDDLVGYLSPDMPDPT